LTMRLVEPGNEEDFQKAIEEQEKLIEELNR